MSVSTSNRGKESVIDTSSGLLICRWNDNSVVTLVSSLFGVLPKSTARRWSRKLNKEVQVPVPLLVSKYNQNMGGTDRMDENISYYRPSIRINKWWWPIFIAQIQYCLHNAWQIYRLSAAYKQDPLDNLAFTRRIARTLLISNRQQRIITGPGRFQPIKSRIPEDVRFDGRNHFLYSGNTQRRCVYCGKKTVKLCTKDHECPLDQSCSVLFHTRN
ncbi:hypothetical protein SNE40_016616 [Patella caerulea]|uniref:PiggyBac transposable element-derived protein domain-containing protein n=1 Tax=Patella caerulea TaxID=87958 RepID=A0AAN8JDL5_PATCE